MLQQRLATRAGELTRGRIAYILTRRRVLMAQRVRTRVASPSLTRGNPRWD